MNPAIDVSTEINRIEPDEKLRCGDVHIEAGGGGVNVARAMQRLEVAATAVFPAGGQMGAVYEQLLKDEEVAYVKLPTEHAMRRINSNIRERSVNRQYRFCTPGTPLTEADCRQILQCLAQVVERDTLLVISGSLPPGAPADFYAQIANTAAERGVQCIFDASDSMTRNVTDIGWSWILPNKHEFEQILGHSVADASIEDTLEHFIQHSRVDNVLLTMGTQGAVYAGKEGRRHIPSPDVEKVSSVGAGDSATAGLACALAQGHSHTSAIRWAVAAGSAAVMTAGSHLLKKQDFDNLLANIERPHP